MSVLDVLWVASIAAGLAGAGALALAWRSGLIDRLFNYDDIIRGGGGGECK